MKNIHDLTNLLRDVRSRFQAEYIDAEETRKKELEALKRDFIPNTPTFSSKEQEIQLNFDVAIIKARERAAATASEEIEDLRQWELSRVGRIDETLLTKINALRGIPVTTSELKQVLSSVPHSNYWVQKAVGALAEENGIPVTDLPLDASLDTKLSVLSQLEGQLDNLLKNYDPDPHKGSREVSEARFLLLNDDILKNAVDIYTNNTRNLSEMDAATQAYYKIKAMPGQMSKACAISNSLRNLKSEDAKNMLLYRLSKDSSIRVEAYEVAGISDVMSEWKHGKAERYGKAVKLTEKIKSMQDVEKIKEILRNYMNRVQMGSEPENEFLRHEITKTYKKNTFVGRALEEMGGVEVTELLGGGYTEQTQFESDAE